MNQTQRDFLETLAFHQLCDLAQDLYHSSALTHSRTHYLSIAITLKLRVVDISHEIMGRALYTAI